MAGDRYEDVGSAQVEERADLRRYLGALRRDRRLIAAIVAAVTLVVFILSLILPKSYEATATIVLDVQSSVFGPPDAESTQRRLATIQQLLSSTQVLQQAAADVGDGETADSLDSSVESAVDEQANLIDVTGHADEPRKAAVIANSVAQSFLNVQQELERERLSNAREELTAEAEQLQSDPNASGDIGAIQDRIDDLRVQEASAGSDLQIAQPAQAPDSAASPRPLRNAVIAFFAALFLGILVSLGRDQLRPVVGSPRELSRLFGRPVLSAVPYLPRRVSRSRRAINAVEHEAYQNLRSAIQLALPPRDDRAHVILVTSAVHAEGKSTVTARLGRSLAQVGHRTLLISADLRWPSLHTLFDLPLKPGLTDALELVERGGMSDYILPATMHAISVQGTTHGPEPDLHVLTSGTKPADPARVLVSDAMRKLVEYTATLDYKYVFLDAPPMLGLADVQGLAAISDRVVVVARLDRVTLDQAVDMEELIERLGLDPLGLVVIGARVDVSPYYLTERPPIMAEGASSERPR